MYAGGWKFAVVSLLVVPVVTVTLGISLLVRASPYSWVGMACYCLGAGALTFVLARWRKVAIDYSIGWALGTAFMTLAGFVLAVVAFLVYCDVTVCFS
jgi:hypothetical protein